MYDKKYGRDFEQWRCIAVKVVFVVCLFEAGSCQSVTFRFWNFLILKLFNVLNAFGFDIENSGFENKYWIQFQINLVPK